MSLFENPATIPMLSAIGGALVGALGSTVSAWMAQRHQDRWELVKKRVSGLEQLYADFINEAARLLVDAVQHSLDDPSKLVPIYALISRIRLSSSTEVIDTGEHVVDAILATYFEPNLGPGEIRSAASKHAGDLRGFSNACRRELESLRRGF